ncbi:MAG TPA: GGDEF domain-containing protein [Candidatus Woesebacteria bacterium]|nr:GGDEF domain-containing protein [Candidatus Woesebacteria bacterium]
MSEIKDIGNLSLPDSIDYTVEFPYAVLPALIEAKKKAFKDQATECYNRNFWKDYANHFDGHRGDRASLVVIDINNLKKTNDAPVESGGGHLAGDKIIKKTADFLMANFTRKNDRIIRFGGDEFIILCNHINGSNSKTDSTPSSDSDKPIDKFDHWLNSIFSPETLSALGLDFAYGAAHFNPQEDHDIEDTLRRADKKMYQKKMEMKSNLPANIG